MGIGASEYKMAVYNATHFLKKYFPTTPIFFTLGNHDCYPYAQLEPNGKWL